MKSSNSLSYTKSLELLSYDKKTVKASELEHFHIPDIDDEIVPLLEALGELSNENTSYIDNFFSDDLSHLLAPLIAIINR